MTWPAANACAKYLGKRLPTEEEWEVAARGEKTLTWPWGDDFGKGIANTKEAKHGGPRPVGSMKGDRSPFGVRDMGGNVSEMTSTFHDRQPVRGKLGTEHTLAYRGGSYAEGREAAQVSYRWTIRAVGERIPSVGFRCVISEKDWKRK
jgi:formylglycine-generating enzyme required for sulfatase activity